jgi:hypothetical protein
MADQHDEQVPPTSLLDAYDDDTTVTFDDAKTAPKTVTVRDLKEMEQQGMITIHQRPDGSLFFRLTDAAYQYSAALRN